MIRTLVCCTLALSFSLTLGCLGGASNPEIVPLTVTVKNAKGKPVNRAQVRLIPQDDTLDGNFIAKGVTDKSGICEMKMPGKSEASVPVGTHKVLVSEAPASEEARAAYMRGDPSAANREKSETQKIPDKYSKLQSTPLTVTVSSDQTELEIVLE